MSARPRTVIFLGPTMPVEVARARLPDALFLPPAEQGDLLSVTVNLRPQVIGLIDGVFLQSLSVWHKEILYAIEQGVHVFGSSSMGALRAAELDTYGMRGVGEIYRRYADGELLDDDEVALAHESGDRGFKKLSEPLINLRATFAAAQHNSLIDESQHMQLIAIAKRLYFGDRLLPVILQAAIDDGFPTDVADRLTGFCRKNYVDLKAHDAIAMLDTIAALPPDLEPAKPVVQTVRSAGFDTMYNRDRVVPIDGRAVPLASIANYAALHDPNYSATHFSAMNRFATVALAKLLGITVDDEQVEEEADRFRIRLGLETTDFGVWLTANHLSPKDFRVLMVELALCRRVHRWFLYARWTQRSTNIYLDQLRLDGTYEEWAERTASYERLLADGGHNTFDEWLHNKTEDLMAEHASWTDVRFDAGPATWAEDAGFHSKRDLKYELLRARAVRLEMLRRLADQLPDDSHETDAGD